MSRIGASLWVGRAGALALFRLYVGGRPRLSKSPNASSTGLPQHVLYRLGVLGDDRQQHARGRIRVRSPLFQFRSVAGGKPNLVANCAWLSPIFIWTSRTSTSG